MKRFSALLALIFYFSVLPTLPGWAVAPVIKDLVVKEYPWRDVTAYLPKGYVTDGSVEYTTYIQQALDDAGVADGGIIIVPFNLTILTNRLHMRYSNVHLIIQGKIKSVSADNLTTAPFNGAGGLINVYPATYIYDVEGAKITDVSVEGPGSIIGPYATRQAFTPGTSAIVVESCNYFKARKLNISQFGAENILVGPATKSNYALIEYNTIVGGGETGVSKSYGSMIRNNWILNGYSMNGISGSGSFGSIINNYIDNSYRHGIAVGGSSGDNATYSLLVQGNKVYRSGTSSPGEVNYGIFINEDDPAFPVQLGHIIDSNHVYKTQGGHGIVGLVNNVNSRITISNNTVSDTATADSIGIYFDGAATFIIQNNTVFPGTTGGQSFGIRNGNDFGTSKAYISGNTVWGHIYSNIAKNPTTPNADITINVNNSPGMSISFATDAPTDNTITHSLGELVINTDPWQGDVAGWLCTIAGSPGTWTPFYTVYGVPTEGQVIAWDNTGGKAYWKTP